MRPMLAEIQKAVCQHYGLRKSEIVGPERARNVARPRQVGMYLAREMTVMSLPEIGRRFGGRDHTTVFYAVERVRRLMMDIPDLALEVSNIRIRVQRIATKRAVHFRKAA